MKFLEGKKSFLGALIIFSAGGFKALELVDEQTFQVLVALGGAISVYGLRNALMKKK